MLDEITPGIWCAEHDVRLPLGPIFRSRMTVADLGDGELLLHSPVPIDDAMAEAIEARGAVRWIVAPNDQHHLFAGQAAARFPDARVYGSEGAQANEPEVDFDGSLKDGPPAEWSGRLEMVAIDGTRYWNEFVFLLPESRTLVCSDLVFNIHDIPNLATNILLTLIGAKRRLCQSRSERWLLVKDRPSYAASLREVLAWDFDRLIMAHGRIVEQNARARLAEALAWAVGDTDLKMIAQ